MSLLLPSELNDHNLLNLDAIVNAYLTQASRQTEPPEPPSWLINGFTADQRLTNATDTTALCSLG